MCVCVLYIAMDYETSKRPSLLLLPNEVFPHVPEEVRSCLKYLRILEFAIVRPLSVCTCRMECSILRSNPNVVKIPVTIKTMASSLNQKRLYGF